MSIVLVGNPGDGFHAVGPFTTPDEAATWAAREGHKEWWVMPLEEPSAEEDDEE